MVIQWLIGVAAATSIQRIREASLILALFSTALVGSVALHSAPVAAQSTESASSSFSQASLPLSTMAQFSPPDTSAYGPGVSTCAIEMVGWVICPTLRTIARMGDYGFAFINKTFLEIDYNLTNTQSGTYKGWEVMRNIANIVFVLVFLIIIYSQVTGRNAGGYSIKRILPRLILGAILVNISYFICAIAAELSNILGSVIFSITNSVVEQIGGTPGMSLSAAKDGFTDGALTEIVSSMLTKGGTVWILLAPIAVVTTGIALVSAVALVLLIARKVVAAALILISPLMFVAYLLPNTENYFKQWVRLSLQILLIYPVVALLLGTGQIVSATIDSVGDSGYKVQDDTYASSSGATSTSAMTRLAAAAAAVMPLLGVWFVMKGVTTATATAGSKFSQANRSGRKSDSSAARMSKLAGKVLPTKSTVAGANFDKRPTFMRRRRKSALGGSVVGTPTSPLATPKRRSGPGTGQSTLGAAPQTPNPEAALDPQTLDRSASNGIQPEALDAAAELAQTAPVAADQLNLDTAAIQASLAKDDLSSPERKGSLLDKQKPPTKDQMRSFNSAAGQQQPGGPVDGSRTPDGSQAQQSTPASAQAGGINTSASSQAGAAPVQQVIAAPTVVDASSLLQKTPPMDANIQASGHGQAPLSESESKAKARAQKYMFDAANDVDEARKALDLKLTERPSEEKIDLIRKDDR